MFFSILYPSKTVCETALSQVSPDFFYDLNLAPVVSSILRGCPGYGLEGLFFTPPKDRETILYRQDIMKDLEDPKTRETVSSCSRAIFRLEKNREEIKKNLSSNRWYENSRLSQGRLLECAENYCHEVERLLECLVNRKLASKGMVSFRDYLLSYSSREGYLGIRSEMIHLRKSLSGIHYCMNISNGTIRVRNFDGQPDLTSRILSNFARFQSKQGDSRTADRKDLFLAEHVEAAVLNLVAVQNKDAFSELTRFSIRHLDFSDETLVRFSMEVQFFLSYFSFISPMKSAGLPFCFPQLCSSPDHFHCTNGFDIALASKILDKIVVNDFSLDYPERILVVTGPNQGGKTTYARAFGQIHWLASLGLCVPGNEAVLYVFDQILTHFGHQEKWETHNGRLRDDLTRLHDLLQKASPQTLVIINEIFASATYSDGLILGRHMMDTLISQKIPSLIVTFLDELSQYGESVVSMVSQVDSFDPCKRTFKIIRKRADGLAYALDLVRKHQLTQEQLERRIMK